MSHKNLYLLTSFACGIVTLVLSVILCGVRIRKSDGFEKYGKARWCLVAAIAVFSVLNLLEISFSGSSGLQTGSLTGSLVVITGSLLAMFFTMTALSFIRPSIVNRKRILAQLAVIIPPGLRDGGNCAFHQVRVHRSERYCMLSGSSVKIILCRPVTMEKAV